MCVLQRECDDVLLECDYIVKEVENIYGLHGALASADPYLYSICHMKLWDFRMLVCVRVGVLFYVHLPVDGVECISLV